MACIMDSQFDYWCGMREDRHVRKIIASNMRTCADPAFINPGRPTPAISQIFGSVTRSSGFTFL